MMFRTCRLHPVAFLFWCLAVPCLLGAGFIGCRPGSDFELMVDPGTLDGAFSYYKETFDELGLNPKNLEKQALVDSQNLSGALAFLGYKGLSPQEVEDLPSAALMQLYPEKLLASAFFAPKITDVSKTPVNVGWRKVVRFLALPGSEAEEKGIAAGYLLFNKFQGPNYNLDPFKPRPDKSNESKTTQFLLTRAAGSKLTRPVYFLVYGPVSGGGTLITYLTASFDARDPKIVPSGKYYVPNSCAECHGGKILEDDDWKKVKVNYLDTDHWFDRLGKGDDFEVLANAPFGILYDGGKDPAAPQFQAAFDILRRLNEEIQKQNESVEPNPDQPSFQLRAVRKWNELHQSSTSHQNPFARTLPSTAGEPWKADQMPDKELLPLLNRYCFRCHSSLRFNVFDRPEVGSRKAKILSYLEKPINDKFHMPQDRVLPTVVKDTLKKRVGEL